MNNYRIFGDKRSMPTGIGIALALSLTLALFQCQYDECQAQVSKTTIEGYHLFKAGKHKEARDKFSKAISQNKNTAEGYHGRAICNGLLKQGEQSAQDFEEASRLYARRGEKEKAERMKLNAAKVRELMNTHAASFENKSKNKSENISNTVKAAPAQTKQSDSKTASIDKTKTSSKNTK